MIIETNSLYKLTRPARAVKDREFLGATAITELERLIRLDYLGLTPDDILDDKKVEDNSYIIPCNLNIKLYSIVFIYCHLKC